MSALGVEVAVVPPANGSAARHHMHELGPRLVASEYPIIPLLPHDAAGPPSNPKKAAAIRRGRGKAPGDFSGGRWRLRWAWQKGPPATAADVAQWSQWPAHGIGIRCGLEGSRLIGIDIDVTDEALSVAIGEAACSAAGIDPARALLRIGRAPKRLLLFRAETAGMDSRTLPLGLPAAPDGTTAAVELIAAGKQFVAYGVHPATGRDYAWPHRSPLDVPAADLPVITGEQIAAFLAAVRQLVEVRGGAMNGGAQSATDRKPAARLADQSGHLAEALAFIPSDDYHDWIRIGAALKGACPEDEGRAFELWDGWSEKSDKYDPEVARDKWGTLRADRIGAGTIYHLAASNGWRPPRDTPEDDFAPYDIAREAVPWPRAKIDANADALRHLRRSRPVAYGNLLDSWIMLETVDRDPLSDASASEGAGVTATQNEGACPPTAAIINWDDDLDGPEPDPLVAGMIDQGSAAMIYGKPGALKSFIAMKLAHCIASGEPFAGRRVETGAVLYVAAEGHSGLRKRIKALRKACGGKNLPLAFMPVNVNLPKNKADRDAIRAKALALAEQTGQRLRAVIIDTVSATSPGMDENSAADVSAALAALRSIVAGTGAACISLHHEGKGTANGPRGSSAFTGNVDAVLHVTYDKKANTGAIESDKERDAGDIEPIRYRKQVVETGRTVSGALVDSCVVQIYSSAQNDFGAALGPPEELSDTDRALDHLALQLARAAKAVPSGEKWIKRADVAAAWVKSQPCAPDKTPDKAESARKAVKRWADKAGQRLGFQVADGKGGKWLVFSSMADTGQ